jgi:hypothetical protein
MTGNEDGIRAIKVLKYEIDKIGEEKYFGIIV